MAAVVRETGSINLAAMIAQQTARVSAQVLEPPPDNADAPIHPRAYKWHMPGFAVPSSPLSADNGRPPPLLDHLVGVAVLRLSENIVLVGNSTSNSAVAEQASRFTGAKGIAGRCGK
jgi:hypothetical protein